jgi:hypothetical protein
MIARLARSHAVHALGAFIAMGSWAFFANRAHGLPAALTAGALQGVLSAGITLSLKTTVERLAPRFHGAAALWAPPALAALVSAGLLTALHALSGTPEILATVALPLTVATSYACLYNISLWKLRRR